MTIYTKAGRKAAAMILGIKSKRLASKQKKFKDETNPDLVHLTSHMKESRHKRLKNRGGISLPWLVRSEKTQLTQIEAAGWSAVNKTGMQKGKPFQASRSWVYKWMICQGYISRKKGNKRPTSPEDAHPYISFVFVLPG